MPVLWEQKHRNRPLLGAYPLRQMLRYRATIQQILEAGNNRARSFYRGMEYAERVKERSKNHEKIDLYMLTLPG